MTSHKKSKRESRSKKRQMPVSDLVASAVNQHEAGSDNSTDVKETKSRVTRLNQRLVLIVAVCSLLLAAGMHGVRHFQLNRNAEIYLKRATSLQEEGKSRDAILYLSRYLQFRPDDVDARATLGQLIKESSYDRRSWQHVFLTFEDVVRRDPSRSDIRRELVDVAVRLGRFGGALVHLEYLKKESPDDGELAFLSAVCHAAENNLEEAAKFYCKSIEKSQSEIEHYDLFARFVVEEFDNLTPAGKKTILKVFGPQIESPANAEELPEPNALIVADTLLDFMVRRGQPAYKARLARSQFPYQQQTSALNSALQEDAAENRATTVLNNLDTNQDGLLDRTEWMTAPFVPSMVDSNEDQKISLEELTDRYQRGADFARLDLARRDVQKALDLVDSKERSEVLRAAVQISMALSQASRQQGKTDESKTHTQQAREYAQEGLKQQQLDLRFYLMLSDIAVLEKDLNLAEKYLKDTLEEILSQSQEERQKETLNLDEGLEDQIRWSLAELLFLKLESSQKGAGQSELSQDQKYVVDILIKLNQLDESQPQNRKALAEFLDKLNQLDESQPRVKYLNGRMLFAERQWQKSSLKLEEARRDLKGNVVLRRKLDRILAICYQRLSNPDAQIDVFRRALREDPVWVDGRTRLGTALAATNRLDDALTEFQSVSFIPGVPTAIAALLLRKQSVLPESRRGTGRDDIQRALDAEMELSKVHDIPLASNVPILRAELQMIQQNYSEAQDVLEKYRDEYPENAKIWAALSNLQLQNTDLDKPARILQAEKNLSEAREKLGERIELRIAAMQIAVAKPVKEAERILQTIESETKNLERFERIQILQRLATAYARISSNENVSKIWAQLVGMQPDDLRPLLVLAELALKEKKNERKESLEAILEAIRRVEGVDGGPNGNYIEAMLLLRKDEPDGVKTIRDLLTSAAVQRPMWAAVPSVLGHLENSLNNWDAAVEHYRTALAKGSRSKSVIVPLIRILRVQQRDDEADQILRQLRNENPSLVSGELARIHSSIALKLDQPDEALRIAVENAEGSDDVLNKIFKAEMLFASGRRGEEVEGPLREAVKNASEKQPEHLRAATIALVTYLSQVKKLDGDDGAVKAIAEASKYLPAEPPYLAHLTLANCYEILYLRGGENSQYFQKAEEQYLLALNSKSDDSEIGLREGIIDFYSRTKEYDKANEHLDQLLKSKKTLEKRVRDWANRRRAMIRASGGSYTDTVEALKMLTLKDSDLNARATILSTNLLRRPFKKDQIELIEVLERIEATITLKLTQKERLQLAQLYEATGDWPKSRETTQSLLEDDLYNPLLLEYAVLALLRHHNDEESVLFEAERLVGLLELEEPDSFRTITTQARLLAAQQQAGDAAELLNNYFGQAPDEQKDEQKIANMNKAASLLEELGQFDDADVMYRKYAKLSSQPEAVLQLISFLGRRNKHAEAFELCEKSWETVSTHLLATVAMATIRDGKMTGRQVQQIERRLKTALKKVALDNDRNSLRLLRLLLVLADLRDYQGQYDQVETLYRRMLEIDQNHIITLNNYAWFLVIRYQHGDNALPLIKRAIVRAGPVSELLDTHAVVLLSANRPSEALEELTEAIDQKPSPIKYFHLAQTYLKLSNYSASKKALNKAKDEGLNWDQMHPLERKEWKKLAQKLSNR